MSKTSKLLITCTFLIGIGITLCIVGFLLGGRVSGIGIGQNGIQIYTWGNSGREESAPSYEEAEVKLDSYQNIRMNVAYANVEIKESDHYGIAYKIAKRTPISYEIKDGVLNIDQGNKKNGVSSNFMFFGFSGVRNEYIYDTEFITVYIPKSAVLGEISIKNDCGDINLSNLEASSLALYNDYGNIGLTSINTPVISLQINSGNLTANNIKADNFTIVNDYGNVELDRVDAETLSLEISTGSLDMENISAQTVTVTDDYGDVTLDTVNAGSLSLKLNTSDLTLNNITAKSLISDIDYGSFAMDQVAIDGDTDITINSGSLKMKEVSTHTLSVINQYGSVIGSTLSAGDVNFTLESGNCEIKDFTFNNCEASSDYGDVTLHLTVPAADYSYDLYTDYGTIKIDNQDMGGKYRPISSSDTEKQIKIGCESGNIKINSPL
ncbi:DUF4097 family beta strand repeat-containing protein [Kineothrix sp. MB12-C1]|uniref:DUF4097 family beta strand repeat-containing protein n=1 Tax=Kineothrix sp. MB12-C1 TaxID=3070215 RepID=UPI0027D31C8A|nr:DUF4097 family beta strand repeat-containing protein [Kineothrix sp. MB12-C1]WMC94088.1 DUF4097 family beta strand repeat-containing protein [Kineothrix sp. MB12-C1]